MMGGKCAKAFVFKCRPDKYKYGNIYYESTFFPVSCLGNIFCESIRSLVILLTSNDIYIRLKTTA